MLYDDTVILLFAKAPIAGSVNTRLIPDIGVEKATSLQSNLIHQRLSMLTNARLCQVRLMCAPDDQHESFIECAQKYPIQLVVQSGDDLGERMSIAVSVALQSYKYCIVIGTDAPALDEIQIEKAIQTIHYETEVVFVPAEDGGYVLLGMKKPNTFLFQNVDWGSESVMQQSRERLNLNRVSFKELTVCWDVDRLEDYQRYLKLVL